MLSNREMEVLELMADGLSNEEIENKLYIAEGTLKKHIQSIYRKLGVNNKTNAVVHYLKNIAEIEQTYVFVDWRDQHSEQLAELFQEGKSVPQISEIMGLPQTAIRQRLESLGLIL